MPSFPATPTPTAPSSSSAIDTDHSSTAKTKKDHLATQQALATDVEPVFALRWGGYITYDYLGKQRKLYLSNTCTIDNFLAIFFFIFDDYPQIRQQFELGTSVVHNETSVSLLKVYSCFKAGKFMEGKSAWISFLRSDYGVETSGPNMDVVELYGSESARFVLPYGYDWMSSNKEGECTRSGCRYTSRGRFAGDIILRSDADIKGMPTQEQMKLMWHNWFHPVADDCRLVVEARAIGACGHSSSTLHVHFKDHQ